MPVVPGMFTPAAIVAPLKSSVASSGMLSRRILKSRASMIPVTVRSVTVASEFPPPVIADDKPPAVDTDTVMACATKNRQEKSKSFLHW